MRFHAEFRLNLVSIYRYVSRIEIAFETICDVISKLAATENIATDEMVSTQQQQQQHSNASVREYDLNLKYNRISFRIESKNSVSSCLEYALEFILLCFTCIRSERLELISTVAILRIQLFSVLGYQNINGHLYVSNEPPAKSGPAIWSFNSWLVQPFFSLLVIVKDEFYDNIANICDLSAIWTR